MMSGEYTGGVQISLSAANLKNVVRCSAAWKTMGPDRQRMMSVREHTTAGLPADCPSSTLKDHLGDVDVSPSDDHKTPP